MKAKHIFIITLTLSIACTDKRNLEKNVFFTNPEDGTSLAGTLSLPKERVNIPAVVLVHGSGSHDRDLSVYQHKVFKTLSSFLSEKGIAVLRYDKRGAGSSGGTFIPFDLENFTNDGLAAIQYLKKTEIIDPDRIGAIGLSQGGLITPMMAVESKDVKFIVMMAGPGVEARELLLASQLGISKAAGYNKNQLEEVENIFETFWGLNLKRDLNSEERTRCIKLIRELWSYIDEESREDFAFLDANAEFFFDNIYHSEKVMDFYDYDPTETLLQVECPVLALNGDKDVQVIADINIPAIEQALKDGKSTEFKTVILVNHNHIFQKCKTGRVSEYRRNDHAISEESMSLIANWILTL